MGNLIKSTRIDHERIGSAICKAMQRLSPGRAIRIELHQGDAEVSLFVDGQQTDFHTEAKSLYQTIDDATLEVKPC